MEIVAPTQSLWKFSIDRYSRRGVPDICLHLQDTIGVDVNLVLFVLWLGFNQSKLSEDSIKSAMNDVEAWRENVVKPMRGVRRWLKTCAVEDEIAREKLRESIQSAEIECERIEQDMLFAFYCRNDQLFPESGDDRRDIMGHNLVILCAISTGQSVDSELRENLVSLCL